MSANDLTTLPDGVFDSLTALERLDLRPNGLMTLPAGVFDSLSALKRLHLRTKATLLPDVFDSLSALEYLNLNGSDLTTLPANIFDGLPALEELDLSANDLTTLPDGVFDSLTALERLDLTGNDLTTLPGGVFDSLSTLEYLNLRANDLTTLPPDVFDSLSALERLGLGDNDLSTLPSGVFDSLPALKRLGLWRNALTTLPDGVFDGLSALEQLSLADNDFTTLPAGVFDSLPTLEYLDLRNNFSLTTLPAYIFDRLSALEYLDLRNNPSLTTLPIGVFDNLLDTLGPINPDFTNFSSYFFLDYGDFSSQVDLLTAFRVDDTTRSAHFVCSRTYAGTIVDATDGVDDCLRITAAQFNTAVQNAVTTVNICDRTPQVEAAILAAINPSPACEAVPEADLAGITSLDLTSTGITSLASGDFTGLSALEDLNLFDNDLTTLPVDVFGGLSALERLDISNPYDDAKVGLTTLPAGVFDSLSALVTLRLHSNGFTTLPAGVFDSLAVLVWLDLGDNALTTLPDGVFDTLSMLERLDLGSTGVGSYNALTTLPDGVFDSLTALEYLDLRFNRFTTLPDGIFDSLTALEDLDLHGNDFTILPDAVFDSLAALRNLSLSGDLTTLPDGVFDSLAALEGLFLGANRFTTLPDGVFDSLSTLEQLGLNGNDFTTLPADIFDGLTALERLDLRYNPLTTLPDGVFDSLSALERLDLRDNPLTTLPDGVFDSLAALEWLWLSNNAFTTLPDGVFNSLTALERLDLRDNPLTTLPDGVFDSLAALERLNLSSNTFTTLPNGLFDSLTALERLSLSNNALTTLPDGVFENLTALEYLDLTGNNFTILPTGVFDDVLDTLGPINPEFADFNPSSSFDFFHYGRFSSDTDIVAALQVDDNTRSAHFVCSQAYAGAIVAATAGVDDCLRITTAQFSPVLSNAGLSALTISEGTLTPVFDRATFTYSTTVPNTVTSLTITPTTVDSGATVAVTVNGGAAMATTPFTAALDVGANGIEVVVTGADSSMLTYRLTVTRESARVNICDRTPQVEAAILAAINPSPACEAVPESDLALITSLDLREAGITSLASGDFTGLSALVRLNLSNNTLTTLPDGVFDSLTALVNLNLFGNDLTTLPAGVFDSQSALESLNFNVNDLTTLPDGVFDSLSALESLNFNVNDLTTLPDGVFDSLAALEWLGLNGNALTTLPDGVFDSLAALTSLNLSVNTFTTLPDGVFDNLAALVTLDLRGNALTTLPDGVFDSLLALERLSLGFNAFTTLPDGVFDSLSALERLDLGFDDLTTLPDGVFDSLAALERLDLSYNDLTTLPDGVFDSLAALERLSLRNNSLTTLLPDVFDDLSALEYLDLTGNNFTTLPAGVFDDVLDTLGPINPDFTDFNPSSNFDFFYYGDFFGQTDLITAFLIDDNTRSAHFVCSQAYAGAIVAATAGVDDCLRITIAQLSPVLSNAGLNALTISEGTLTPVFDRATFTYGASVLNTVTDLTITPTTADSGATVAVTVNGGPAMTTAPFTAALDVGANGIEVVVTGADSSMLTYRLTVTRKEPELGITNNMLTVTDTAAGFEQTVAIGSTGENNGVIAPIVNVPNFGPLSMPTFSFGLYSLGEFAYNQGTGTPTVSSSSYRFRAGMVIDEPGSMRRLELDIPIVNMDIGSDGTLTGTIPPQDFNVWGRSADGQTVAASLPINPGISFNDNTFQFDADVFIERIQSDGGLLAGVRNVINTIDARGATFTYSLVLKQVKDPTNSEVPDIAFGSDPGASFVAFPTVANNATEAEGFAGFEQLRDATGNPTTQRDFNAIYADGYRLTGQVSFVAASTGPVVPGPTDPGPTDPGPTGPGGGGAVPPPALPDNAITANDQLTEAITGIDLSQIPDDGVIDPDMVASINNVLEDAGALADLVSSELDSGDLSASESIDSLATLSDATELAGAAIQAGAEIETATVTGIIDGIADIIDVLGDTTLSPALMNAVQATAQSTLAAVADLVADDAEPDDTEAILDSASALVNAVVVLDPDTALTEDFKATAQSLAESVLQKALDDIAAGLGQGDDVTFTDTASTRALLAENPTLLDEVLEVSAISLTGTTPLDTTATQSAIEEAGVSPAGAEALTADLNQFVIPTGVAIEIDDQANDVVALLNDVLLDADITAAADSTTGSIGFAFDSGAIEAFVTDVAIVPDSVPEGVFIKPDGSAVIIEDGVAISVAPSPAEPIEFVAAIESVGEGEYTTTIRDNGAIALTDTLTGYVFNGTFSFDSIVSAEPVAETFFTFPEGNDPADPAYRFSVTFENGSTQPLLPMIAAPQFYDSLSAQGLNIQTDRSSGVIITDRARFRPDYFSRPATSFEILFLNSNVDESGVAYIPTDANGDGIEDFIVITRINGVATAQVVYQLP